MISNVKKLLLLALSASFLGTVGCEKIDDLTKDVTSKIKGIMKDDKEKNTIVNLRKSDENAMNGPGPKNLAEEAVAAAQKNEVMAFKACFTQHFFKDFNTETTQTIMDMLKEAEIGAEMVNGNQGTIEMTIAGQTNKFPCVKEDGKWRFSE